MTGKISFLKTFLLFLLIFLSQMALVQPLSSPKPGHESPSSENQSAETLAVSTASLSGSYRIRLPLTPFRVKNKIITISLCNIHKFKANKAGTQNQVRIQLVSSTEKACLNSNDELYIRLIQSVTSYAVMGRTLYLYKEKDVLAFARRDQDSTAGEDNFDGKWNLEIRNLPLEVSDEEFSFQGCNANSISYKATDDGKISFGVPVSTEKACNVDTDAFFVSALQNSQSFTTGQVSFKLYDANKKETVSGTPYLS